MWARNDHVFFKKYCCTRIIIVCAVRGPSIVALQPYCTVGARPLHRLAITALSVPLLYARSGRTSARARAPDGDGGDGVAARRPPSTPTQHRHWRPRCPIDRSAAQSETVPFYHPLPRRSNRDRGGTTGVCVRARSSQRDTFVSRANVVYSCTVAATSQRPPFIDV